MIDFPLVDTHLHLWDPARIDYPWLASVPPLNRPFLLPDYREACGGHAVEKMVFVQCEVAFSQYRQEVEFATEHARIDPRLEAIVAWAPLENGDAARPEIQALAANPLVRGIRRIIQFEADPAFCLRPGFIAGVAALADYNLRFDLCIKGLEQTANTIQLVRHCPGVRFILDHIGKPFIDRREMEPWRSHLREFAAMENVSCKVSGLVVEADVQRWTPEDLRPYLHAVLEAFGPDRVMFGGDWPVVTQAATLERWIDTLDALTADLSGDERRKFFRENAVEFYRLGARGREA